MDKIKYLITGLLLLMFLPLTAQQVDLNKPLPKDPSLITGKLPNGLTYYIKYNAKPKHRVFMWLVENAGSVCEDSDQQGLAHFTEHMAFNGTKNFPKNKLIKFLQSTGMRFGADLNAYTSFDETVFMLEVPTDSPQDIDTALLILHDWSHYLSFNDTEIDKERGVIEEEWRLGRGANDRMMRKVFPVLLANSKYAHRIPIGKIDIIKNFKHDVIRRFYHDWYRPDLQAIIIVGDINPEQIKNKIVKLFSNIPNPKNERPRIYPPVPGHKDIKAVVATDSEAAYQVLQIYWKHHLQPVKTYADYKRALVRDIVNQALNSRFMSLMLKPKTPFAFAMVSYGELIDKTTAFTLTVLPKKGQILQAEQKAYSMILSAKKYGFTQEEIQRAKKRILARVEKLYKEQNKTNSKYFLQEYHANFSVAHMPIMSLKQQYQVTKQLLPLITASDVNNEINRLVTDSNMVVVLTMPKKGNIPTSDQLINVIKQVKKQPIQPFKSQKIAGKLIKHSITPGTIVSSQHDNITGATVWTLSNGMKVVIKPTKFKNDEILFSAFAPGGVSVFRKPKDIINARLAADMINNSGVGSFNSADLQNYLAGKNVNVSPFINTYFQGINGQSDVKSFPTALELVYAYMREPRFDKDAFQAFIEQEKTILANKANDPTSVWSDTLVYYIHGKSLYYKPLDNNMLSEVNFKRAYKIYKQLFANPKQFTFVFVGNIDTTKFKPLIEKYLGGIKPTASKTYHYRTVGLIPTGKVINKIVRSGKENKSLVYTVFTGETQPNLKNEILLNALSTILTQRMLDTIREAESITYSIAAFANLRQIPKPQYGIYIFYSCAPDTVNYINHKIIVLQNQMKQSISDKEFSDAQKILLKQHETQMQQNKYWLSELVKMYQTDSKPDFVTDYDKIVQSLTKKQLINAAKTFFNPNSYISIILKPKK